MVRNVNDRPQKAPSRSLRQWGGAVHMLARFYINYIALVARAAHRKKKRAVDVDGQDSIEGTLWAFHWATVGKNKLHDPAGRIGKNVRIDSLTDAQIDGLRGPRGQRPQRMITVLELAADRNVRIEVEAKALFTESKVKQLLARPKIKRMDEKGLLQFKTLAFMGAPNGPIARLRPIHDAGGTTILSFTGFRRGTISKSQAWPVTDYVRGRARWSA